MQKDNDQLSSKTRELESYLSTLPTKEELEMANKAIREAKAEHTRLVSQNEEIEKKLTRAKRMIRDKVCSFG